MKKMANQQPKQRKSEKTETAPRNTTPEMLRAKDKTDKEKKSTILTWKNLRITEFSTKIH